MNKQSIRIAVTCATMSAVITFMILNRARAHDEKPAIDMSQFPPGAKTISGTIEGKPGEEVMIPLMPPVDRQLVFMPKYDITPLEVANCLRVILGHTDEKGQYIVEYKIIRHFQWFTPRKPEAKTLPRAGMPSGLTGK